MRTPVIVLTGQGNTDAVAQILLCEAGTVLVEHRFDGHVVHRAVTDLQQGIPARASAVLELAHGCVACTIRDDLLAVLRALHRRTDVHRIVVQLTEWLEPEPVCWAIGNSATRRDVEIAAVVSCVDTANWLSQAVGDDELDDGRTVAQVVVGQMEFADLIVLTHPDPLTLAVARRLAPRSRITVGRDRVELALAHLEPDARRGRSDHPHAPLLAGQPPLDGDGPVRLVEFNARRPFHPQRLHAAVDLLLDGVVRTRGRLWLASRPDRVMWLESAGGGMRVSQAGKWLAAMTSGEVAYADPERRVMADLIWAYQHGDRHTSMVVLVCGADPREILDALRGALLGDEEFEQPEQWAGYADPFGDWHTDPCDDVAAPIAPGDGEDRDRSR